MIIRLIDLMRTIRLYGQSAHPRRMTGNFKLKLGQDSIACVELFEGHINKAGPPQRLVSFVDASHEGAISAVLINAGRCPIEIVSETNNSRFDIERVVLEVTGISDSRSTELRFRGQAKSQYNPDDVFTLFET